MERYLDPYEIAIGWVRVPIQADIAAKYPDTSEIAKATIWSVLP
jgi:hypothetical protein